MKEYENHFEPLRNRLDRATNLAPQNDPERTSSCANNTGRLAKISLTLIAGFILVSSAIAFTLPSGEERHSRVVEPYYVPHVLISVDGDADFVSDALLYGWPGDGSAGNPIMIRNYEINASGFMEALHIGNTTLYYVVSDCMVEDALQSGIVLFNTTNGIVRNNTCLRNVWNGIYMYASSSNVLLNNTIAGSKYAIRLSLSDNNSIIDNSCQKCAEGLNATYSNGLSIEHNELSNNTEDSVAGDGNGLVIISSNNATISHNSCSNNSYLVFHGWLPKYGSGMIIIDSENCSLTENECDANDALAIHLVGCANASLSKNKFRGSGMGGVVLSGSCAFCSMSDNYFDGDTLLLRGCKDSVVTGNYLGTIFVQSLSIRNNISSNTVGGVMLYDSADYNLIDHNGGVRLTIALTNSHYNTVSNNSAVSATGSSQILLTTSNFNTLRDNNCSFNRNDAGIYLWNSSYNELLNNTCYQNKYGIEVFGHDSMMNTVSNSRTTWNLEGGIYLARCRLASLRNNVMSGDGVVIDPLSSFSAPEYWGNHDIDTSNTVNGRPVLYLKGESGLTVPTGAGQVILAVCSNVLVEGQGISNTSRGIQLGDSIRVIVRNNSIWGNLYGIYLTHSEENNITQNGVFDNDRYGIYLYRSGLNSISGNSFMRNGVQAFDNSATNNWNFTGSGNYWSNWLVPDSNYDGIVDLPYEIDGENGSHTATDYYPLTSAPPENPVPAFGTFMIVMIGLIVLFSLTGFRRSKASC
jgi:parallel beta-helix repeat protein